MKLTIVSFLFFSSFSLQAMSYSSFFEQNKHDLENPARLDLLDYSQKINTAVSENLDWQNFLANVHQTQKAIEHITRFSGCIRHDIVAAIILLNTPATIAWARSYAQKKPIFIYNKLNSFLNDVILLPESMACPLLQTILSLPFTPPIKPTSKILITVISKDKIEILKELLKTGVARTTDGIESFNYSISQAKVEAVKAFTESNINIMVKSEAPTA